MNKLMIAGTGSALRLLPQLWRTVADLTVEKQILKNNAQGNW